MYRRVAEGAGFILLGLYLVGYTLPRAWNTLNTDFPNYYLAARLTREGVDPSRAYEWIWLQREKDHRNIDQRIVGLVPITPFSTLAMWPLTRLSPLAAKHAWLIFNLVLLFPIAWLMRAVSGLSLLQVGCLLGLCFPLHRNLLYGQYYIVLLGILTAACWAVQRQRNYLAGSLIALGGSGQDLSRVSRLPLHQEEELGSTACLPVYRHSVRAGLGLGLWLESSPYLFASGPSLDTARRGSRSL